MLSIRLIYRVGWSITRLGRQLEAFNGVYKHARPPAPAAGPKHQTWSLSLEEALEAEDMLRAKASVGCSLGVDVKVILITPCIFCIEKH